MSCKLSYPCVLLDLSKGNLGKRFENFKECNREIEFLFVLVFRKKLRRPQGTDREPFFIFLIWSHIHKASENNAELKVKYDQLSYFINPVSKLHHFQST